MITKKKTLNTAQLSFEEFKNEILNDYRTAVLSRECSLLGRKEVLTGKGKFGIFGDGKEIPQIAMAKAFKKGDWRSGYYRDQTFMMAIGEFTPHQFFAGLYAHPDIEAEPFSAGRQMGGHYASHSLNDDGSWKDLTQQHNVSADMSSTASQMPRLVGLAQASKIYRELNSLKSHSKKFSNNGNEIAWGTIGNASTSEGLFFETINAAGVLQVPIVISVWDDDYGISVHNKHHTTKESISEVLKGFQRDENNNGFEIITVNGWDYVQLMDVYTRAAKIAREEHVPVLIHVTELTQPQGHSTSGSHERYKSKERLQWEKDFDCNVKFREWILEFELESNGEILRFVDSEDELIAIDKEVKKEVSKAKREAWSAYLTPLQTEQKEAISLLTKLAENNKNKQFLNKIISDLGEFKEIPRKDVYTNVRKALIYLTDDNSEAKHNLVNWLEKANEKTRKMYNTWLYNDSNKGVTHIPEIKPTYTDTPEIVDGRIIIRDNFEAIFNKYPEALVFGEDVGKIGDVNQGLEGLQDKFGEIRIADTGIREPTIMGQGVGMALRGLRPIAEIQYLDYLVYALQTLTDDLASLRYRTFGKQTAPLIIRTRGHRLEGIWHSGSPMQMILGSLRGVVVLVPRNMEKAAGFYNTLLQSDEPAIVIESLNGYRLKEKLPTNLGEFTTPIGVVETVKEGTDITVVSYGSTLRIVQEAAKDLLQVDINIEVIDIQSLLPFDIHKDLVKSLQKTNRLLIVDEDVPGGASAYILQEILENQNGYKYLDSKPVTLTAKAHRPAYGSDGDYYSKPNVNDIFETAYAIMHDSNPKKYLKLI
ncbi:alpha-ketoacid dehydrogenase subunit alpha/beta [Urechidicola croceus]|uniref:3-methyl-2-oxobutanoate dehydrogenase (2-methylpropanoyl-transferring) n=1 Tax=Urechidicola croceus TaxID=1850246 RepID=A0A1D8P6J4_9FLAO|nr:alpha-ketoacid dehydrogenase subunit alpha/beta [Urechidicola croceus]AOW20210.1 transketolase [Urechidicola croceus]